MKTDEQNAALRDEYEDGHWVQAIDLLGAINDSYDEGQRVKVATSRDVLEELCAQAKRGEMSSAYAADWVVEIKVLKACRLWPVGK